MRLGEGEEETRGKRMRPLPLQNIVKCNRGNGRMTGDIHHPVYSLLFILRARDSTIIGQVSRDQDQREHFLQRPFERLEVGDVSHIRKVSDYRSCFPDT